ncbi:MAG: hypothetical protein ACYTBJ_10325 [Planctomycetota bacterium]|jgi:hypothetical protein
MFGGRDMGVPQITFNSPSLRNKVSIKTGDARFNNLIQALGARVIYGYEYPGFLHAANYLKYGKINCGHYGIEAAGYHEEVQSSLKFISGSQCVKGRQRYFTPNLRISEWAKERSQCLPCYHKY